MTGILVSPVLLTLYWMVPRTTAPLLLPSVNHSHAVRTIIVSAGAFGAMCPLRTVVIGPVIHLQPLLRPALRAGKAASPGKQALPRLKHTFAMDSREDLIGPHTRVAKSPSPNAHFNKPIHYQRPSGSRAHTSRPTVARP